MRFPFFAIGLMCLALGVFTFLFFILRGPDGPVSGGIELPMAFVMVAFGSYVVWQRFMARRSGGGPDGG
ncbi:MAG: hypothetical protein JF888_05715 [Candidatus Dormibacteraeota bacterium]|uniref:Uncharacterized protein n=1 Tax=Candidatus Dormiibacter inghamiae TaxID=3127013 RepID=A0A934NBQ2_9BACT|nr:hypothetical protein [Candidatus Dormibacteraeota bacterium]MBJ7605734.1 hypothetical protein [Candidatus Dormibacteraeota bacterium]MDQ6637952.1 hypothetical protein [Candidatus Dormibacteraeota bacterium]PZR66630.1 MAG: hypothetical protein DLM66_13020 [Candidatus Dormibacteraeota bacterium]